MTNFYLVSDVFVRQIVIITNFVVVSSVGIKRVVCIFFIGAILRGARVVQRKNNYNLFLKTGGIKQARKDFRALNANVLINDGVSLLLFVLFSLQIECRDQT